MPEATIRAEIKTVIEGVSNVGLVYDYERWAVDWSVYLDLFKTTIGGSTVIRGWTVTCAGFREKQISFGSSGTVRRRYTYKVRGYAGLSDADASEKTFMSVVEDVVEALSAQFDDDSDETDDLAARLDAFEPRMFGSVLCHYAEITLAVIEDR